MRRCDCIDTPTRCGYPHCQTRRCGRCHVCRFVGVDELPVLTTDEQRFLVAWNIPRISSGSWWDPRPKGIDHPRLTAAETRLVFKLCDMGLVDA